MYRSSTASARIWVRNCLQSIPWDRSGLSNSSCGFYQMQLLLLCLFFLYALVSAIRFKKIQTHSIFPKKKHSKKKFQKLIEHKSSGTFFEDLGNIFHPIKYEENKNGYEISIELPGFDKNDISLKLQGNELIVHARREQGDARQSKNFEMIERFVDETIRSLGVPEDVERTKIRAKSENGVLYIKLPKLKKDEIKNPDNILID